MKTALDLPVRFVTREQVQERLKICRTKFYELRRNGHLRSPPDLPKLVTVESLVEYEEKLVVTAKGAPMSPAPSAVALTRRRNRVKDYASIRPTE